MDKVNKSENEVRMKVRRALAILQRALKLTVKEESKICKMIICPFCVSFEVDGVEWTYDIDDIKLITYHKNHYRDLGYTIIEQWG